MKKVQVDILRLTTVHCLHKMVGAEMELVGRVVLCVGMHTHLQKVVKNTVKERVN